MSGPCHQCRLLLCRATLKPVALFPWTSAGLLDYVLNEGVQRCAKVGALWEVERLDEARESRYLKPNQVRCPLSTNGIPG